MTNHEKDQVLAVLKHYLPMELRATVMREVPAAYNAWMGREVVAVVRASDGSTI